MSSRNFRIVSGLTGIVGVLMLGTSFGTNPGPPPGATQAQLVAFGHQYFAGILWGAWLQAVGSLLIVLFALALVSLANAAGRYAGMLTLFGGAILTTVSLVETSFYISALMPSPANMGLVSLSLIGAIQHLYFMVAAPALFLPLGCVLLSSTVLPRAFGYLGLLLGGVFAITGVATLFTLTLPVVVQLFASVQAIWWLAAGIALIVRTVPAPAKGQALVSAV